MGFKTQVFRVFFPTKRKIIKIPNFMTFLSFQKKKLKIQILDSQSQQKIIACQSNGFNIHDA